MDKPLSSARQFKRDADGSARVRLRLAPDLATDIERANNGEMPLMDYLFDAIEDRIERDLAQRRTG